MPIRQAGMLARRASTWPRDPLLPQGDGAAAIEADDVKRVLADIDADRGDHTVMLSRHGVLLSLGASCQPTCRQGPGARPDHPITGSRVRYPLQGSATIICRTGLQSQWQY